MAPTQNMPTIQYGIATSHHGNLDEGQNKGDKLFHKLRLKKNAFEGGGMTGSNDQTKNPRSKPGTLFDLGERVAVGNLLCLMGPMEVQSVIEAYLQRIIC